MTYKHDDHDHIYSFECQFLYEVVLSKDHYLVEKRFIEDHFLNVLKQT